MTTNPDADRLNASSADVLAEHAERLRMINHQRVRTRIVLIGLGIALCIAVMLSLNVGRYGVPLSQIWHIISEVVRLQGVSEANLEAATVLWVIRLPRICLSILVGACLAAAGAAYQGLFKNPMVSPDILGVSSGAGVGAALGILLGFSSLGIQMLAFVFGIAAVTLVMTLAKAIGRGSSALLIMVLAGTVISSIFSSFTSLIKYLADADAKLPEITFWLMGSFARSGSFKNVGIMVAAMVIGAIPLLALRWRLNVLSFGEEEARAMGINTNRIRLIVIVCSTILTATSVSLCGTIGWVGLIMPHITRLMVGPDYRMLLPTTMLVGGLFMVIVDNVCRLSPMGEIPVGIVTSLIGAPLFIYMLFKGRRDWA